MATPDWSIDLKRRVRGKGSFTGFLRRGWGKTSLVILAEGVKKKKKKLNL